MDCFLIFNYLQVQLVPYNPDQLDSSILWTESKDMGDGYRAVRMVNNVHLNMDAFHGDKYSGGVHDGTIIVLWQWNSGDNQHWKISSTYCKFQAPQQNGKRITHLVTQQTALNCFYPGFLSRLGL